MTPAPIELLAIGGSAGALDALVTILPGLPELFFLPIVLVLHIPQRQPSLLPEVLGALCRLTVKEAEDKEPIVPGTLYVAPPNYHLLVERSHSLALSIDAAVHYSRPSIDVLFESAAAAYGARLAALLLTGANEDGARGLAAVRAGGGTTLVQAPATAIAATMPEAALRIDPGHEVVRLAEIADRLGCLPDLRRPKRGAS